jgi:hypothetical protein
VRTVRPAFGGTPAAPRPASTVDSPARALLDALRDAYRAGARAAAAHASSYDASTTHDHQLGDAILHKMNLIQRRPRRNDHRLRHPDAAWALGFASALAEVLRLGADPGRVQRVARDAGLTLGELRRAGAHPGIVADLRRAGVSTGDPIRGRRRRSL